MLWDPCGCTSPSLHQSAASSPSLAASYVPWHPHNTLSLVEMGRVRKSRGKRGDREKREEGGKEMEKEEDRDRAVYRNFAKEGGGGGAKLGYGKKRVGRKDLTINISYNINHSN